MNAMHTEYSYPFAVEVVEVVACDTQSTNMVGLVLCDLETPLNNSTVLAINLFVLALPVRCTG